MVTPFPPAPVTQGRRGGDVHNVCPCLQGMPFDGTSLLAGADLPSWPSPMQVDGPQL